jgi:hypothetical protein
MQQRLYFCPLPHGQGSFRPGFGIVITLPRLETTMYTALLADGRLYQLLQRFDDDLAAEQHAGGCLICGAVLHSARYPRKPRGFCRFS